MDLTRVFTGFRASTEAAVEKKRAREGWQSTTDGRGSRKQMNRAGSVPWSRGAGQGQGPGLHTWLTPAASSLGCWGRGCPHFPVKETESLWKSPRVSETMNKTRHSGVQVRTSSLKSKRQTLRHAWCVWSRDLSVIRVPACAHKF